jgi:chloride channel 3/4/5
MMELTGSLTYVIPVVLAILVSKWTGDALGQTYGIFDLIAITKKYPLIPPNAEADCKATAASIMTNAPICISNHKESLGSLGLSS